jgi:MFS family permease
VTAPRTGTSAGVVFLVLFLDLISFGIVFPIYGAMLSHYLARDDGFLTSILAAASTIAPGAGPDQQAALFGGILGALYAGLQFLAAPFWGRLSDRIGRRPVLLMSLAGSLAANLLWVFSADILVLLVARCVAGVFAGNVATAHAAIADITTPERRGRAMALVGLAFGLGFVIGPAIGGVAWHVGHGWWDGAAAVWGLHPFSLPALIATALAACNWLWAWRSFRETLPPERRGHPGDERPIAPWRIFGASQGRAVGRLNLAFCVYTLLFAGMETTLVFLLGDPARLGWTPLELGGLFVGMGLTTALAQGAYRGLVRRHGAAALTCAGLALFLPGMGLIGVSAVLTSAPILLAGVGLLACSSGLVFPGVTTLVSLAADPARQGHAMGTFRSAGALGRAVGPLIAAAAYFGLHPAAPYALAAVAGLAPLVLLLRLRVATPAA